MPSTVTWINPGSGDWDTASNWFDSTTGTNHVPTANDDAVISTAGITVTHSSFFASDTVNSLTSQATLSIANGGLNINTPSTTQNLTVSGGTLTIATPDLSNPGSLEVGSLKQTGGTITGPGTLTVDNSLVWTGGTMAGSGHTDVQGTAEVGGGSPFGPTLNTRTLDNFGTATIDSGSNLLFAGDATLNNQAGGQLTLAGTANLGNFFGSSGFLNNAGTLTRSGLSTTAASVSVPMDNTGIIDVQTATLTINAGLTNEGSVTVEPGAVATINGGNSSGDFNLQAGSHLNIGGTFTLLTGATNEVANGAQLEIDGAVTQQSGVTVTLSSTGILKVAPSFSNGGPYILANGAAIGGTGTVVVGGPYGQMTVSGAATINNLTVTGGTVTISAKDSLEVGTLTQQGGTITGPGTLTVDNTWSWTGGSMSGSGATDNNGTGTVGTNSFGPTLDTRTVNNGGSVTVPANDTVEFQNNAAWNNLTGSTLVLANNSSFVAPFSGNPPSGSVSNAGTIARSGLGTSTIGLPLDNTGTIDVATGTLTANAGLTNEGSVIVEPGAVVTINGGNSSGDFNLQAGGHLNIGGTFTLLNGATNEVANGAQLELDGAVTQQAGAAVSLASNGIVNVGPNSGFGQNYILADGAAVRGGTVLVGGGSSLMTVSGAATINNLAVTGGTVTIKANDSLEVGTLSQTGGTITGPGTLTIDTTWSWTGGTMSGSGQTVNNGTATVGNSSFGTTLDTRTVANGGTVTLPDSDAVQFKNAALWNNQAGGTLVLGNNSALGNFFGNSGSLFNAGTISDSGPSDQAAIQLSLGVVNSGTISLQGVLNMSGSFKQTSDGTLTIVFTDSGTNGELKVNGSATLNGTLNVSTPSDFAPSVNQSFTIMTFTSVSGDFASFTGLTLGNGLTLTPSEHSTNYTLTAASS